GLGYPTTLLRMHNLAVIYRDLRRFDQAKPLFQKAYRLRQEHRDLGPTHPDTILSEAGLGWCCYLAGEYAEALPLLQDAFRRLEQQLGADHSHTLAALDYLGKAFRQTKQFDKAEAFYRGWLKDREAKQPQTWTTFLARALLGSALLAQSKWDEAEPLLLQG